MDITLIIILIILIFVINSFNTLNSKYQVLRDEFCAAEIKIKKIKSKLKKIKKIVELYKFYNPNWQHDYLIFLDKKNEHLNTLKQEYINDLNESLSSIQELNKNPSKQDLLIKIFIANETLLLRANGLPKSIRYNDEVIEIAKQLVSCLIDFRKNFSKEIDVAINDEQSPLLKEIDYRLDMAARFWTNINS